MVHLAALACLKKIDSSVMTAVLLACRGETGGKKRKNLCPQDGKEGAGDEDKDRRYMCVCVCVCGGPFCLRQESGGPLSGEPCLPCISKDHSYEWTRRASSVWRIQKGRSAGASWVLGCTTTWFFTCARTMQSHQKHTLGTLQH